MYNSQSYPYPVNQSPCHPQQAPAQMPTPPQPQPASRISYPGFQSPASSIPMPTPGVATGGVSRGSSEFPLLEHLSVDELQRLLGSDDKLNDIADDGNQSKQRQVDKEMAMAENRSLADFNLSRETRLREGRIQLARLHEEMKRIRDIYDVDRRRLESASESCSLDTAKVMLETAASKTEDESEEITELFLEGNLPISDFVEQFIQRRTLAHVRRIKSDKMQEFVKSSRHASSTSSSAPHHSVNIPMTTPLAQTPSPARPAPSVPQRPGHQMPLYQPGYPSHVAAATPAPAQNSQSWTPHPGAVRLPSLPAIQH